MLRSLVGALRLLAGSRPPPVSAGSELLAAARGGDAEGGGAMPPNLATPGNHYVRREACAAWGCMQARAAPRRPSPAPARLPEAVGACSRSGGATKVRLRARRACLRRHLCADGEVTTFARARAVCCTCCSRGVPREVRVGCAGGRRRPRRALTRRRAAPQAECKRLLAELLHAPSLQATSFKTLQSNLQTQSGWMRGGDAAPGGGHRDASGLSFSFDVQVAGQAPQAVLDRNQSLAVLALPGKQSIAQQALGGAAGGTHLAPALYRPVLRFVEGARRALAAAEDGENSTQTLNGNEPSRRGAPDRALLDYLEAFISDSFLPDVYVDFRGRATDMLAAPDAFRARARARTAYAPDVAGGRPVVPAAREMEAMVAELLRWAVQMPPFAHEITGAPPPRRASYLAALCLRGGSPTCAG